MPISVSLEDLLRRTAARHARLCPRQVLGVRMGMLVGDLLGLVLPQEDKRLLTIVETDGCVVDGIEVATGCTVGHRTLRVEDYGKVAATFVDTQTHRAVRIVPRQGVRQLAREYAPGETARWHQQLVGYQRMPADVLFGWQWVLLTTPLDVIVGREGQRVVCTVCGEEIINGRELWWGRQAVCRACGGACYYRTMAAMTPSGVERAPVLVAG